MGVFNKILLYFYLTRLNSDAKMLADKPRQMMNIQKAETIGLLFNATNANDIITVTQFADMLAGLGKKVIILGYQENKDKENNDPKFFNKLNVNWHHIPFGEKIDQFQKHSLDILICAFVDECLPLEYIAATSKAKFRVGAFSDAKTNYFELMINTQKNQNLKYLLAQINHFLKVINP